eukprot:15437484-Alexandrium_andersonii.AAC.1
MLGESRKRASDRRPDTEWSADRRPGKVAQRVAGGRTSSRRSGRRSPELEEGVQPSRSAS